MRIFGKGRSEQDKMRSDVMEEKTEEWEFLGKEAKLHESAKIVDVLERILGIRLTVFCQMDPNGTRCRKGEK